MRGLHQSKGDTKTAGFIEDIIWIYRPNIDY